MGRAGADLPPSGSGPAGTAPGRCLGRRTRDAHRVFVNGRELHTVDVIGLQQLIGQVLPGRWWVNAQGNDGLEGGPPLGNLMMLARAGRAGGGGGGPQAWSKHYEEITPGQNMNLARDGTTTCFSVGGDTRCTGM